MQVKLNSAQAAVVAHNNGPMLVVAGAGTGKTKVIIERIARLIENGAKKSEILALTFTEKAAQEMLDRASDRLQESYGVELAIHTYNAFGQILLEEFAIEIGLSANQKLVGEEGKVVFMREHLDELELDYFSPVSQPDGQLSTLADYFSKLKQQLITPQRYEEFVKTMPADDEADQLERKKHQELARAYATYVGLMRKQNIIDYDDQIYLLVELLQRRPNVRKKLQQRFRHIMVDEFQDTNPMQSALIDLLYVNDGQGSLMVVGDDDQAIYGWRGATLTNILEFTTRYPNAEQTTLIKNYRTTQEILDSAWLLIQENNPQRLEHLNNLDKRLVANRGSGNKPKVLEFNFRDSELSWVAEDITKRISAGQDPGSIAVLARSRSAVADMHSMLDIFEIPHVVAGLGEELYDQPIVLMMIDALRAVWNPDDNTSLYHTLTSRLFDCDARIVSAAAHQANIKKMSLGELLSKSSDKEVCGAIDMINNWHNLAKSTDVRLLSYDMLTESKLKDALYEQAIDNIKAAQEVQTLSQWFKSLKEFEKITLTPSVVSYLENFPVLRAEGEKLHDDTLEIVSDKPVVMTMHKAKGLEWQTVYVIGCASGSFPYLGGGSGLKIPDQLSENSEADLRLPEERRLMYVAVTRARDDLILTYASTSNTGKTTKKPSRFVEELGLLPQVTNHDSGSRQLDQHKKIERPDVALPISMIDGENIVLSASQAEDYLLCPLNFFYKHILNVPEPDSRQAIIGSLYHSIIESINKAKLSGENIPTYKELLNKLQSEWPESGYSSQAQRKRDLSQALTGFKQLYQRLLDEPVPIAVEENFRVDIPDSRCVLKGRIDVVMPIDGGVEMHDYKTSTAIVDQENANKKTSSSKQLTMYALAWQLKTGEPAKQVSLDYVRTGNIGRVRKTSKSIETMQSKLAQAAEDILAGSFELGAEKHDYCIHPL